MLFSGKKNITDILGFVKESQNKSDSCDLLIICKDGSMRCQSFGLIVGSSFWREMLFGKIYEEQICIICTEFKMTEFQSMLDFILDGKMDYCEKDRMKLAEIAIIVLPDLKMFEEGKVELI